MKAGARAMPTPADLAGPPPRSRPGAGLALVLAACLWLASCASPPAPPPPPPEPAAAPAAAPAKAAVPLPSAAEDRSGPGAAGRVAGRNGRWLVYLPEPGDHLAGIAKRFLGSEALAWRIADAQGQGWQLQPRTPVVVPLTPPDPMGITHEGVQTVPILCYHRFGAGNNKMIVSAAQFEAQLEWLARNHYRVLRLDELLGFLAAREPLPQRSVVITIDDGYETVHRHAFPLLKKYGMPATLFVYSDFIGARDGLSWAQLQEMADSGLVDLQAHSKTHRNLIERGPAENDAVYRANLDAEVRTPKAVLERRLASHGVRVHHFAFPFGDANEWVLEALQRHDYDLAVTVNPGGNPFFAHPLMLRRTMIFGDHDLEDFKARLQIRRGWSRP